MAVIMYIPLLEYNHIFQNQVLSVMEKREFIHVSYTVLVDN